ncbi:cuticular protein 47Eg [Drosophila grimshawi]|uniref:GH21938 n=1 Tax=Drosophila grimshawi TaxID=7222 RepID=B4J8H9_DROGR|nr:cuticular protein 47Eg [Drosophila grimshawi]EDW02338.1 GH21938 [Drosophila grimshawi]
MKLIIALSCLLVVAFANEDPNVLKNDAEVNVDSFKYSYEFDNSIKADQQGELKGADIWYVTGQNSHTSPEGEQVSIQYQADENGYQVLGANPPLPTSPPIPEAIQRALDYIRDHPSQEDRH